MYNGFPQGWTGLACLLACLLVHVDGDRAVIEFIVTLTIIMNKLVSVEFSLAFGFGAHCRRRMGEREREREKELGDDGGLLNRAPAGDSSPVELERGLLLAASRRRQQ